MAVELAQLFADDTGAPASLAALSDLSNPWVMLSFYRRLFPFKHVFQWLSQDHLPTRNFTHREFAFTLRSEVYLRYQSFNTWEDFKKETVRLNPARFEIGPVYSGKPKDRKALLKSAFRPQLRELVFDIDMTDYDSIRTCCQDKAMCVRCWKFIAMAVKVLDRTLRDDFGFAHLLWVYSGRRGIHVWISDEAALALTDDQRRAIVNYLEVIKGGAKQDKKVNLSRPLHPSMEDALKVLKPWFAKTILRDQECFKTEEQWESLLRLLPDKNIATTLRKKWTAGPSVNSMQRWKDVIEAGASGANDRAQSKYHDALADIVLQYTYPRIDTEVSKHLNHLLKSPFCIHPGTGRVCVPLLPSQVDDFDPINVPTVGSLLMELEQLAKDGDDKAGWEKTKLKPYVDLFKAHCDAVMKDAKRGKREEVDSRMEL